MSTYGKKRRKVAVTDKGIHALLFSDSDSDSETPSSLDYASASAHGSSSGRGTGSLLPAQLISPKKLNSLRDSPNETTNLEELVSLDPLTRSPKRYSRTISSMEQRCAASAGSQSRSRSTSPTPRKQSRKKQVTAKLIRKTLAGTHRKNGYTSGGSKSGKIAATVDSVEEEGAWSDLFENIAKPKAAPAKLDFNEKLQNDLRIPQNDQENVESIEEKYVAIVDMSEWEKPEVPKVEVECSRDSLVAAFKVIKCSISGDGGKRIYGEVRSFLEDVTSETDSEHELAQEQDVDDEEVPKSIADLKSLGRLNRDTEEFDYFIDTLKLQHSQSKETANVPLVYSLLDVCKDLIEDTQLTFQWKSNPSFLEKFLQVICDVWQKVADYSKECPGSIEYCIMITIFNVLANSGEDLDYDLPFKFFKSRLQGTRPHTEYSQPTSTSCNAAISKCFENTGVSPEQLQILFTQGDLADMARKHKRGEVQNKPK